MVWRRQRATFFCRFEAHSNGMTRRFSGSRENMWVDQEGPENLIRKQPPARRQTKNVG